jgi:hypothetical protein
LSETIKPHETSRSAPETVRIRPITPPARLKDRRAVEALQTGPKHRTVLLVQEALRDVDDAARIDADQIAVIGKVMDRARDDPIHHDRRTPRIAVIEDVGRLQKSRLPQGESPTHTRSANGWRRPTAHCKRSICGVTLLASPRLRSTTPRPQVSAGSTSAEPHKHRERVSPG